MFTKQVTIPKISQVNICTFVYNISVILQLRLVSYKFVSLKLQELAKFSLDTPLTENLQYLDFSVRFHIKSNEQCIYLLKYIELQYKRPSGGQLNLKCFHSKYHLKCQLFIWNMKKNCQKGNVVGSVCLFVRLFVCWFAHYIALNFRKQKQNY